MSWSTDFEELFATTVTVGTLSGVSTDGYSVATYTTGTSYKARVFGEQTVVRSFAGIDETATTTVWIASTSTFAPSVQITLPDGTTPELLAMQAVPDEDGVHHIKAKFA